MKPSAKVLSIAFAIAVSSGAASSDGTSALRSLPAEARRPVISQLAKLTASDGAVNSWFASSVAMSGDTIVAGAYQADNGNGAVYVFVKPQTGWQNATETAKLTSSDNNQVEYMGDAVAISGDTIVSGASGWNHGVGAAYVFVKPAGGWANMTETAKLTSSSGKVEGIGAAVAISPDENTIVASGTGGSAAIGKAYIFQKQATGWASETQSAMLEATNGKGSWFGAAAAMTQDTIVIGAPNASYEYSQQGGAYVFERASGGWKNATQNAVLYASDAQEYASLGWAVSISGNTIVAGAPSQTILGRAFDGAAYVFEKPAGGWKDSMETAELTASDPVVDESLGLTVFVAGRAIASGAPYEGSAKVPGKVYGFTEPAGGWSNETQRIELMSLDGTGYGGFGYSVAISDKTLAAGYPSAPVQGSDNGAVYVFGKQP